MVRFGTGSLYSTILTHYRLDTSGWLGADTSVMGVGLGIQMLSIAAAIIAVIVIGVKSQAPVQPLPAREAVSAVA